jgi:hypothetical protein
MPISIEADSTLPQGYLKVNGTTAATVTSTGLTTASLQDGIITPAKLAQPYTMAAAQASTSGTSVDFTGVPSWVKRISVMLVGVSTSGTSNIMVQLGTSAGFTTSGYLGCSSLSHAATGSAMTTGLGFTSGTTAAGVYHGLGYIVNVTGNTWVWASTAGSSDAVVLYQGNGSIALAATLTRIRITTVNGTDTFDAGTINIAYEG